VICGQTRDTADEFPAGEFEFFGCTIAHLTARIFLPQVSLILMNFRAFLWLHIMHSDFGFSFLLAGRNIGGKNIPNPFSAINLLPGWFVIFLNCSYGQSKAARRRTRSKTLARSREGLEIP
jgi:hypothetical protein